MPFCSAVSLFEVEGTEHKPLQSKDNVRFWEATWIQAQTEVKTTSGFTLEESNRACETAISMQSEAWNTNSLGLVFPSAVSKADFRNALIYHAFHSVSMSSAGKMCYSVSWLLTISKKPWLSDGKFSYMANPQPKAKSHRVTARQFWH